MRMKDPIPTFQYLVSEIAKRYPDLAYLHVTEPRVNGDQDREAQEGEVNPITCHWYHEAHGIQGQRFC